MEFDGIEFMIWFIIGATIGMISLKFAEKIVKSIWGK